MIDLSARESARTILVISAHPDDADFVIGGTVAAWTRAGREVTYVCCTDGDKGGHDPNLPPAKLAETRQREQREAARRLGVRDVIFLGYEDGVLEPTLALRRDLVRVIRQLRPEAVVCQDPSRRWSGPQYINHPDHIAAGEASLAAVYPAAEMRWTFPELLAEGWEPHTVLDVYLFGTGEPDYWVDITDSIDTKIDALQAHESQVGGFPVDELIRRWSRETAEGRPEEYAEALRYFHPGRKSYGKIADRAEDTTDG